MAIIIFTAIFLSNSFSCIAFSFPQPIGMWRFDYTHGEYDVSGHGNHMTPVGLVRSRDSPFEYYNSGK